MALQFKWTMRGYDIDGGPLMVEDQFTGVTSEIIERATARKWDQILNGFDALNFTLALDDPWAAVIKQTKCWIKLWVAIVDDEFGVLYETSAQEPEYSGIVAGVKMSGAANTMDVSTMSALWRTSTHFHLLAHRLVINPETGDEWRDGELMWKIIQLTQNAFPQLGDGAWDMGIREGTFTGGETLSPWFLAQGSWVWDNVQAILDRQPSSDIVPVYHHEDGQLFTLTFNTAAHRGDDITGGEWSFDYNTGKKNCDDMTMDSSVQPGQFGNYGWAMGQGGVDTGKVASSWNNSADSGSDGTDEIGAYMWQADYSNVNRLTQLYPIADLELKRRTHPIKTYTITKSPVIAPHPLVHFNVGDLMLLNADKGAMSVDGAKQRVYEMHHAMTENNAWQCDVVIGDDYKDKYTGTVGPPGPESTMLSADFSYQEGGAL